MVEINQTVYYQSLHMKHWHRAKVLRRLGAGRVMIRAECRMLRDADGHWQEGDFDYGFTYPVYEDGLFETIPEDAR